MQMISPFLTLTLLLTFCLFGPKEVYPANKQLKVITFNTYLLCVGPKCLLRSVPEIKERKKLIVKWLKKQNADIVFLQEIWQPEQFDFIRKESGYPHSIYFGEESDLALLSRYPLSHPKFIPTHWQGSHGEDCKKGVVGYRYGFASAKMDYNGTEVLLANVHPIARRVAIKGFVEPADAITPERLILQLNFWNELKNDLQLKPIIFAGDFNMNPDSVEYAHFERRFRLTNTLIPNKNLCSYCSSNSLAQWQGNPAEGVIDYIFVNDFFSIVDAKIDFPKPDLSDHQPVEAVLELNQIPRRDRSRPVPTKDEINELIQYVKKVSLSPYCYLSYEMGWKQKKKTIKFLKQFNEN